MCLIALMVSCGYQGSGVCFSEGHLYYLEESGHFKVSQQHTVSEYKPNMETIDQQVQSICFQTSIKLKIQTSIVNN